MHIEIITFFAYFFALILLAIFTSKRQKSNVDYVMGGRSLNFWLTALSAHASDMSSWLFLAYPALIYQQGIQGIWSAIGLTTCMFLNWQFVAPKIRTQTESLQCVTLSGYFEKRFEDSSGKLRIVSAFASCFFYCIYIAAGLVALGLLSESLFSIHYTLGITVGILIVMFYVFIGGYTTVAWIDLVQGLFLLGVILLLPSLLWVELDASSSIVDAFTKRGLSFSLIPSFSVTSLWSIVALTFGWGLGYFGQPHIVTKFMGIQKAKDIPKSKYLGISWQILALGGASCIAILGIGLFPQELANPEALLLQMVERYLSPFFGALVLCAILAATTNVMAAQILVVATSLAEDFYKYFFAKTLAGKSLLWASKCSVILISLIAFLIAFFQISSIYGLVFYAWSGIGGTFGPVLLWSLYRKNLTRESALAGIISGACIGGIWPYFDAQYGWNIPALFPVFIVSSACLYGISSITHNVRRTIR